MNRAKQGPLIGTEAPLAPDHQQNTHRNTHTWGCQRDIMYWQAKGWPQSGMVVIRVTSAHQGNVGWWIRTQQRAASAHLRMRCGRAARVSSMGPAAFSASSSWVTPSLVCQDSACWLAPADHVIPRLLLDDGLELWRNVCFTSMFISWQHVCVWCAVQGSCKATCCPHNPGALQHPPSTHS